jgi:hypothetical protein
VRRLRNSQFFILFSELLVAQTSEPKASTAIWNGQACLGDNVVSDLFSAINSETASYCPELTYNSREDSPRPPMRGAMLSGEEKNGKVNEGRS